MLRPGATGMRISGTRSAEDLVELVVEAEPLVLARRIPAFELHDQLDALRRARRGDAEQILDVDHAEAAQLHVMARELGTGADEDRLGAAADFDRVVGDQTMAADDQVERALALADAALADDEHAQAEDVHAAPRGSSSRSASLSSRIDVSLAIASAWRPRSSSSGTARAPRASRRHRRAGRMPPVMRTQGKSQRQGATHDASGAPPASRLSR